MYERKVRKSRLFFSRRCLSPCDYQAKASRYRKGLTYLKNKATTKQKQILYPQKLKRRGQKHKVNENHPTKQQKGKTYNQLENKVENDNEYKFINNYTKFQWTQCSNQKM